MEEKEYQTRCDMILSKIKASEVSREELKKLNMDVNFINGYIEGLDLSYRILKTFGTFSK